MIPQQFYAKWDVPQEAIALICSRSVTTVRRWFARGDNHRHPQPHDLRHLALMNFLLEHFEAIPPELRQQRKLTQFVIWHFFASHLTKQVAL
ncbi:hypothetical protein [Microseira wollei]|uniref:Helix-turn-helix domain-containing protein n=1 Tax=Microseira wollei NIES-4236 TaxID=2530354 RepID=A0AAV3XK06_9CYAN|nr:hypothetical protein [Microseira wollei]GET41923.1 hypothetical protein MiSe_67370 [Microseira wollei NIES-4236]